METFQEWETSPCHLSDEDDLDTQSHHDRLDSCSSRRLTDSDEDQNVISEQQQPRKTKRKSTDIRESIEELKELLHVVCAKVEKNEQCLKILREDQEKRFIGTY